MKIIDILKERRTLSFEIFPPHTKDDATLKGIFSTVAQLLQVRPDFISVTYASIGRNRERALEIADFISMANVPSMSHFTAVGYLKEDVDAMLSDLTERGIQNVLALRGDIPQGLEFPHAPWKDFRYALDLISYIRSKSSVCIGAACYPEGHPECRDMQKNLDYLKMKEDAGADFFITQLFFDNNAYFDFIEKARAAGIKNPIIPGIMPVLKAKQLERIIALSGTSIPNDLLELTEKYKLDDAGMLLAGSERCTKQLDDLLVRGAPGIHFYTMNKPKESIAILDKLYSSAWRKS